MLPNLVLSWTATDVINEDGFIVERKNLTTGVFEEIARTLANVLTYTDPNLLFNTKYTYRVCAFNAAGKSAYTAEGSATTAADPLPKAPTNLIVRPL